MPFSYSQAGQPAESPSLPLALSLPSCGLCGLGWQVQKDGQAVLNQPAFNKALSLTPDRDIKVGVLPVIQFPSGYLFFRCGGQPYCR